MEWKEFENKKGFYVSFFHIWFQDKFNKTKLEYSSMIAKSSYFTSTFSFTVGSIAFIFRILLVNGVQTIK